MNVPDGYTASQVLETIETVASRLAPTFVFGYYDLDDMKQECHAFALEVLKQGKFDVSRPLENFLYVHIKNRLLNLQRKKKKRNDPPCLLCHAGTPCCEYGQVCKRYQGWLARNHSKSNILTPCDLDHISDEGEPRTRSESTVTQDAEIAEITRRIDEELPTELRASYLQMRAGVSIPKPRRLQVEAAVSEILRRLGCINEDD